MIYFLGVALLFNVNDLRETEAQNAKYVMLAVFCFGVLVVFVCLRQVMLYSEILVSLRLFLAVTNCKSLLSNEISKVILNPRPVYEITRSRTVRYLGLDVLGPLLDPITNITPIPRNIFPP